MEYLAILHAHEYCTMSRKPRRLKINTLKSLYAGISVAEFAAKYRTQPIVSGIDATTDKSLSKTFSNFDVDVVCLRKSISSLTCIGFIDTEAKRHPKKFES